MPLKVGSRLGHYNVTALIGERGMGQVYPVTCAFRQSTQDEEGLHDDAR